MFLPFSKIWQLVLSISTHLKPFFRLVPSIRHYDWGGTSYIPALLRCENTEGRPFAELWMGAHPTHPSFIQKKEGAPLGLDALISQNPETFLGHETMRDYGGLPFLLKVLDVAKPLSIQVHPGPHQARAGFDEEECRNVPRLAPFRNYKDPFAKPELVMALEGPFWLLAGFRPVTEIGQIISVHPELKALSANFFPTTEGIKALFRRVMSAPQEEVERLMRPLLNRLSAENARTPFDKNDHRFWVLKANGSFSFSGGADRGLMLILFMNLVKLCPADYLFIPPGVLHAFLEGTAVEISANSDNVLRGGLTQKHMDVAELLKAVSFDGAPLEIRKGTSIAAEELVFPTEAKEFELRQLRLRKGESRALSASWGGRIFFIAPGPKDSWLDVQWDHGRDRFLSGESFFLPRGGVCTLRASCDAVVFQAGIPPVETFHGRRPIALAFGTSGLRGPVDDITDLEAFVNARGFLRYVKEKNGQSRDPQVLLGMDLRPSSPRIAAAVARAIQEEGGTVENAGRVPSPALMSEGLAKNCPSIMVTGSHIPFDRNGIKFNLADGEVLKEDECKILARVREVRAEEYNRPAGESFFDERGMFKPEVVYPLGAETKGARESYLRRYLDFFPTGGLRGMRIVVYQHSAVGRDVLVDVLRGVGADVIALGRSDAFVPIDTEDISDDRLADLQRMADHARGNGKPIDALVSTDGDSDRPLICGFQENGQIVFFPGDNVGPLVAEYLDADGVVAPVSVNDAVDDFLKGKVLPRTRIGSPFVIEGMRTAGSRSKVVVGYEANGGVLLQNEIVKKGRRLAPLPTRDSVLPILCVLFSARERGLSLVQLFNRLPRRFTKAGLLDNFPKEIAQTVLRSFFPLDPRQMEVDFGSSGMLSACDETGTAVPIDDKSAQVLREGRIRLETVFNEKAGFGGGVVRINFLDGLRLCFGNRDVAHIRPSGNAPQLRIYACANSPERAQEIVRLSLREPDGLLRTLVERFQKKAD